MYLWSCGSSAMVGLSDMAQAQPGSQCQLPVGLFAPHGLSSSLTRQQQSPGGESGP